MNDLCGPDPAADELALALVEAVTGAKGRGGPSELDGQDRISTLPVDWSGAPGDGDLPERVTLRVGLYGDYTARFEGDAEPFASGILQETLPVPALVRVGALIRVTDAEAFVTAMGRPGDPSVLSAAHLETWMVRSPVGPGEAGIGRIAVTDLSVDRDNVYFELTAEVVSLRALTRAARDAYAECWGDRRWLPRTLEEALFELTLGSNANPPPDEMGFEFLDFPGTRHAVLVRAAADREVACSPGLIPDGPVPYADWFDLTGRDDSFIGNGEGIPGTRDLFEAALRAVLRPDHAPPEPH